MALRPANGTRGVRSASPPSIDSMGRAAFKRSSMPDASVTDGWSGILMYSHAAPLTVRTNPPPICRANVPVSLTMRFLVMRRAYARVA